MVSKNNHQFYQQKHAEGKQRWGIRKLSVGVASVLLGTTFMLYSNHAVSANAVSANTVPATTPKDDTVQADSNVADLQGPEVTLPTIAPATATPTNAEEKVVATNSQDKDKQTNANETTQNTTNVGEKDPEVTPANDAKPATQKITAKSKVRVRAARLRPVMKVAKAAPIAETPDPTTPSDSTSMAIVNDKNKLDKNWIQLDNGKAQIYFTVKGNDQKPYVTSFMGKDVKSTLYTKRFDPNSLELHIEYQNGDKDAGPGLVLVWDDRYLQLNTSRISTEDLVYTTNSDVKDYVPLSPGNGFYKSYNEWLKEKQDLSKLHLISLWQKVPANSTFTATLPFKYVGNADVVKSTRVDAYLKPYSTTLTFDPFELHPEQIDPAPKPTTDDATTTTGVYNNPLATSSDWIKMTHGDAIGYYTAKGKDGKTYVTGYAAANGNSQSIFNVDQIDANSLEFHLLYHNGDKEVGSGLWFNFADGKTLQLDTSRLGSEGIQLKSKQGQSYKWSINTGADQGIYYNSWAEYLKAHNNVGDQASQISMTGVALKPDDTIEFVIPVKYTGQLSDRTQSLGFEQDIDDYGSGFKRSKATLYFTTVRKDLSQVKRIDLIPAEFMGEQPGQSNWKLVKEFVKDMPNGRKVLKISNFPIFKGSFNTELPKGDLPPVVYGTAQYFIDLSQIQKIFANHGYTVKYANNNGKAQEMPFYGYVTLPLALIDGGGKPVDPSIWTIQVQAVPAIILNKDQHYVADPNAKSWDTTSMIDEIYAADDAGPRKTRDQLGKLPKTDVDISYEYQAPGAATAVKADKVDLTKAGVYTVTYSHTYANNQVVKDSRKVYVDDVKQQTKDITRTIIVHAPTGTDQTVIQKATLTREGILDATTGEIKPVGEWSTAKWKAYSAPEFKGYTPSQAKVASETVTSATKDQTVNITYTAKDQSINVIYRDGNQDIKQVPLTGKTGETVDVNLDVPANYQVVNTPAKTYTFKADGNQDIIVELAHNTEKVTDSKTITRTINVTSPDGQVTTTKQTVTLTRTGIKDLVTGTTAWDGWSTGSWDEFDVSAILGYTPSQAKVASEAVTSATKDQTVNITYTAKDQSINVIYKDGNQVIKQVPLTGKTGETVGVNLDVPANYHVVNTPAKTYTFKADGNQNIIVELAHNTEKVTDSKTITRTINVTSPDGQVTTTKQTVTLTRTGIKDLVTGTTTWDGWSTGSWDEFDVSAILGYTPSQAKVASEAVTSATKDQTVNITYTAKDQSINVIYKDGNQVIKQVPLTGKTGETVGVNLDVPANYHVVNTPAKTYTFKADGNQNIIVELAHNTEKVTDSKTITRTINVTSPDGQVTTTKQTVTLTRTGIKDLVTGTTTWDGWSTGSWDEFDVSAILGYTPSQAKVASEAVTSATKDQTVNITYTAKDQSINVIYKDGNQVIKQVPLTGKTGETVGVNLDVPANYHVVNTPAKTYTFKADGNQNIIVELAHNTEKVTDSKTITRTINVTSPDGQVTTTKQTVTLTRTGIKDLVTGTTTWDGWSTGSWDEFDVSAILGYTPSQAKVASEAVTSATKDQTVNITYTAKDQSINVIYKDGNQVIKQVPLTGKTGETVGVNLDVPANYHVVNTPAKTYTFKADGNQNIIVELAHNTEKVTDSKTITRTINVTSPDGQVTTTKQTVTLTRTGIKDLVTGTTTWDGWSTGSWDEFDVSAILGYTPSQAKVASETVTSATKDQTVNITYTAKDQSINVIYRDGNQDIKQVPLTGKTGETVDVNLDVPANYQVVNTPAKTYTFKADGNQDIIVELAHNTEKVTDSKTITRTINVTSPDGQVTTTKQTVTLTRTGIKDLVTGTTTWDGWSTGSWDEFDVSAILGYTPSQAKVASEAVTSDTKDQTINVSYTPNSINPTNPTNPMNPTMPTSPTMPTAPVNPTTPGANTNIPGAVVTPGQATTNDNHQKANQLPQTGNTDHNAEPVVGVGLAALAGIFGLLGLKKKKREDQ